MDGNAAPRTDRIDRPASIRPCHSCPADATVTLLAAGASETIEVKHAYIMSSRPPVPDFVHPQTCRKKSTRIFHTPGGCCRTPRRCLQKSPSCQSRTGIWDLSALTSPARDPCVMRLRLETAGRPYRTYVRTASSKRPHSHRLTVASWQASVVLSPLHTHGCLSRPAWLGWLCVVGGPVDISRHVRWFSSPHRHAPTSTLPAAANRRPRPTRTGRRAARGVFLVSYPAQESG